MKNFFSPFTGAWSGVFTHKLRSFLTILGIVIGVAAVISLMSVGKGTQAEILSRVTSLGANLISIRPGFTASAGVRTSFGSATTLTLEDAAAIQQEVPDIAAVAPAAQLSFQLIYGSQNLRSSVIGVTPDYQNVMTLSLDSGDFITDYDYQYNTRIAVLGANVKTTLFGDSDPIGQKIRAGNYTLEVVGVLQAKGASFVGQIDDAVFVPLSTIQQMGASTRTSSGEHVIQSIALTVTDQKYSTSVKNAVTDLLLARHNVTADNPDFNIQSMEDIIANLSDISGYMTILLGAIAGISLLVGGIGVMNIMLVSVIERTREIGVRKALGARERDIWGQFLLEAVILTITGGLIGIGMGWGASLLFSSFLTVNTLVSADIIILAVSVAVGIGLFFGFYPAWQASRLNPIEALRHE